MPIRDTRMMAKALEQRWPIKPEYREVMIKRLVRVLADPSSSAREVAAASKGLLAAEAQNQSDEHKEIDVRITIRHDQLSGIAADLGLEIDALTHAESEGGGSVAGIEGASVTVREDRA